MSLVTLKYMDMGGEHSPSPALGLPARLCSATSMGLGAGEGTPG